MGLSLNRGFWDADSVVVNNFENFWEEILVRRRITIRKHPKKIRILLLIFNLRNPLTRCPCIPWPSITPSRQILGSCRTLVSTYTLSWLSLETPSDIPAMDLYPKEENTSLASGFLIWNIFDPDTIILWFSPLFPYLSDGVLLLTGLRLINFLDFFEKILFLDFLRFLLFFKSKIRGVTHPNTFEVVKENSRFVNKRWDPRWLGSIQARGKTRVQFRELRDPSRIAQLEIPPFAVSASLLLLRFHTSWSFLGNLSGSFLSSSAVYS